MAFRTRQKPPPDLTAVDRVARLEAELAGLPDLELSAELSGDEETLTRVGARERIIRRELVDANRQVLVERRAAMLADLELLEVAVGEAAELVGSYDVAAAVYAVALRRAIHRRDLLGAQRDAKIAALIDLEGQVHAAA